MIIASFFQTRRPMRHYLGKRLREDRRDFSSTWKEHAGALPTESRLLLLVVALHCWSCCQLEESLGVLKYYQRHLTTDLWPHVCNVQWEFREEPDTRNKVNSVNADLPGLVRIIPKQTEIIKVPTFRYIFPFPHTNLKDRNRGKIINNWL